MNFIERFLRSFDLRRPARKVSIIDHGDFDALLMTPPLVAGPFVKPPASLRKFASPYQGGASLIPSRPAPNGEGQIDIRRNREALWDVMDPVLWRGIEAAAVEAFQGRSMKAELLREKAGYKNCSRNDTGPTQYDLDTDADLR